MTDYSEHKVCGDCGHLYVNFCVNCAKARREETVEELMDQHGLSVEGIVEKLAEHVFEKESFPALSLAATMKDMKPAKKTDITTGGAPLTKDLKDVKSRLVDKVARFSERKAKK